MTVSEAMDPLPPQPSGRSAFEGSFSLVVLGRPLIRAARTARGLLAFALITLGVLWTRGGRAPALVGRLVRQQVVRAGVKLLPLFLFLALALGFLVIGQTVAWLSRLGAIDYLGTVMVLVMVRELGPLLTALVVLTRVGTALVVELGTARALGEVEALEALGIDPVHYLVVPRVVGLALSVLALTVYLLLGTILSGYLWAFLQDVPLTPGEYFRQLAASLRWLDFVVLALKTAGFGTVLAVVTCYHGLARPLRLDDVAPATVRAMGQALVGCVLWDALFLVVYLVGA
ncbi:MlaE family ABC transporter permease [Limisphaera sp. VF-2]|uniref:MlaE family ABC transporter permease n=1 Tax=Limisphaera sp. VF-2 TaxID=3400418 RepID=UPI003C15E36F